MQIKGRLNQDIFSINCIALYKIQKLCHPRKNKGLRPLMRFSVALSAMRITNVPF